ncbi:MAG: hypothetical protein R2713_03060 [Ilumatobacteraceae bacterium]
MRQFASRPEFADLCHDLVGPDVRLYWDQAVYKKPEKPRRFPWHQDNGYVRRATALPHVLGGAHRRRSRTGARRWRRGGTGRARCATTTSIRSGGSA